MKKLILISMFLFTMILSTGCWDIQDIDERILPTVIAIDNNENDSKYTMNYIMMNFNNGKVLNEFAEFNEDTLTKCIEASQKTISGETSMSLLQTIVLGDEFPKGNTYDLVNWLYKEDINSNLSMCVYKGESKELIDKLNSKEDQNSKSEKPGDPQNKSPKKDLSDEISDFIKLMSTQKEEGYVVIQSLKDFTTDNENSTKTSLIPTIEMKDDKVEIIGTTIFKNYNNIGEVSLKNTKYLMLLRGIKTSGIIDFEDIEFEEKKSIEKLNIFNSNNIDNTDKTNGVVNAANDRKVKVEKINNKYVFTIEIGLECSVQENNNKTLNLMTNQEYIKSIEKYINEKTERECNKFIDTVQKEINYDIFDLSKYAKVKYKESLEDLKDEKFFENSEIKVKVDSKIKNTSISN